MEIYSINFIADDNVVFQKPTKFHIHRKTKGFKAAKLSSFSVKEIVKIIGT